MLDEKKKFKLLLLVLTVFSTIAFIWIFSDTLVNYPHLETYYFLNNCTYQNGPDFSLKDLVAGFDPCLDGWTDRARFYSWFFWILNAKFRYFVFKHIPYLPSLSVTWFFTFTVLPYYFYKLLRSFTDIKTLALSSTFLLFFTQGFLSFSTMYFHAAKPMTMLFIIVCFYYTHLIYLEVLRGQYNARPYLKLLGALILSLFWDEMFYAYFLIVPFWYFAIFKNKKSLIRIISVYGCAFIYFVSITSGLVPFMTKKYFNYFFNFWDYSFKSNHSLFTLDNVQWGYNWKALLVAHVDAFSGLPGYFWVSSNPHWEVIITVLTVLMLVPLLFKNHRMLYFKSLVAMFIFYVSVCLILTRREGTLLNGAFYWGSTFSVFFVIWLTVLVSMINIKKLAPLIAVLYIYLAYCGYINNVNASIGHITPNLVQEIVVHAKTLPTVGAISYQDIKRVWEERHDFPAAKKIIEGLPLNAYWLFYESFSQAHPEKHKYIYGEIRHYRIDKFQAYKLYRED